MRALIGLLLLLGAFVLAATLQETWTGALRRERDMRRSIPVLLSSEAAPGEGDWNLLVIGRPSGVAPLPYPEQGWATNPELARTIGIENTDLEEDLDGRGAAGAALLSADAERGSYLELPGTSDAEGGAPEFVYRIQSGDSLGEICSGHYGTARPSVVRAVAIPRASSTAWSPSVRDWSPSER
jgi:hypothetical protein